VRSGMRPYAALTLMRFFSSYRMDAEPPRGEGFSQKDFALRKAI
jgi:hypothetical protein